MKALKITLAVFLAALIAFAAYFWFSSALHAEPRIANVDARSEEEAFEAVLGVLTSGAAPEVFQEEIPESPNGYTLTDVTITLQNTGPFAAEWITCEVSAGLFDIALYSLTEPESDLAPGEEGALNMKFLSRSGENERTITLQYYVLGMKRTLNISC